MTTLDVTLASEIQAGRYVVVRTRSFFGFAIRVITGSSFDHAFVYLGDGAIAEATTHGVRVDRLDAYAKCLAVVDSAEDMTPRQRHIVTTTARSFAGRQYNWTDIAVILARRCGIRWGWMLRVAENRATLICSELVALSGKAAGMEWWQCAQPDASQVTPAMLADRPCMRPVAWTL